MPGKQQGAGSPAPREGITLEANQALGICRHLRNKKMSYLPLLDALKPSPENPAGPHLGTNAPHWCFHTQGPVGPDGRLVNLEECSRGRTCFCDL